MRQMGDVMGYEMKANGYDEEGGEETSLYIYVQDTQVNVNMVMMISKKEENGIHPITNQPRGRDSRR